MSHTQIQRYGTWTSPLSAADVASGAMRLESVALDGSDIYWIEGRPSEAGRSVLVRCREDGLIEDVTPPDTNVRTRAHEYGGGAYAVSSGVVFYSNFADQRVYRQSRGGTPVPVTPPVPMFYADYAIHPSRTWLVAVREDHSLEGHEPINTLVSLPFDGLETAGDVIAAGYDFYSTPTFSPDGTALLWLVWRHPQMPWDGTELWMADVSGEGRLEHARRLAGGSDESIVQPGWSPDGEIYFVSDRSGWWNLYRLRDLHVEAVHPMQAEFGRPQWLFGMSLWRFADSRRLVASYGENGRWSLAVIDIEAGDFRVVPTGWEPTATVTANATHAFFVGTSPRRSDVLLRVALAGGTADILRTASPELLDEGFISEPVAIEFPTDGGVTARAFYYPPRNAGVAPDHGLGDERPPLLVISHGGPTAAASPRLNLEVQYWTTRGFAVVDVDYGGSSGYGRAYRQRLNGNWGIVDVADCANAARYLVQDGKADPARLIIRGRSAGGYTTLAALTFRPSAFKAGASHYGICDIEVLARDTHKFESRYLDTLVGPYPAMRDLYRARSPIHFVDRLSCPLILFQGLDDKVVPPNQAEMMADAVRRKGLPVALLTFEGEQHGFRKTETIVRSIEAELAFYGAVFGFTPADMIAPVQIDNLG